MQPADIMTAMDTWVKCRGSGQWATGNNGTTPIQQVRSELEDLVRAIVGAKATRLPS